MERDFVKRPSFKVMLWVMLVAVVALLVGSFTWMSVDSPDCPDCPSCPTCPSVDTLSCPEVTVPDVNNEKLDAIYEEIFKEDKVKEIAKELAVDEMDSDDFLEEVMDVLNEELDDGEIDDEDDIYKVVVKDSDVDVDDEEATVSLDVKVYYYLDGDEEETGKARLDATFYVDDLVEDDDYEDAEVEDFEVELTRIYD